MKIIKTPKKEKKKKEKVKKITQEEKEIHKLKLHVYIFKNKSKIPRLKKFEYIAIFGKMAPTIRGTVPGFYLKKKFKEGKTNTTWGSVDKSIFNKKRIKVTSLPQTHIDFLLNEIKYIKYL